MPSRLRILVLHSRYLSGPASGENRVVEDEVQLLRDGGHRVTVWDPQPDELSGLGLLKTGLGTVWSLAAARRVADLIAQHQPHVVHLHNLFPTLSPSSVRAAAGRILDPMRGRHMVDRAATTSRPAVVMTLHNHRLMCLPGVLFREGRVCEDCVGHAPWRGVMHRCYRGSVLGSAAMAGSLALHRGIGTFGLVERYLAISDFIKRKHVEAGLPPTSIRVKPHFAWPTQRREGPGEHFLYLGRLSPEKGVSTIVEAWRTDLPPLMVAGDGPEGPRLRASAGPNVRFLGTVAPTEVPTLLARTRAVLAPSTCYEGAGKSVLEGYAAGVPTISSDMGGLPEVIEEGVTGLLAPAGDTRAWAQAVERLRDDAECARMGDAAWLSWRERYSPERGLRNLEDAYRAAMRARDRSGGVGEDAWPQQMVD